MGSRVAAALLRRGRDQASALLTPRMTRSAPAPAPPRVGGSISSSSCGGGGSCLLPPRPGPAGAFSPASRFGSFHAFRSLAPKAARCTGRSRNGMTSSITNRKDLVHEQNMKILKLQNELEITKADMEVLKADIKLEVAKGQTKMLKYCIFVVGAGLLVETFASWP